MQVQRGVLLSSDNHFFTAVADAVGPDTQWTRLRRIAFAVGDADETTPSLSAQVMACLRLYVETARLLDDILQPEDRKLIEHTVHRILVEIDAI